MPAWVKSHWPKYVEGCERAGRPADAANWRVAKSVFVAKDAAIAKAYASDPNGPYVYYYRSRSPSSNAAAAWSCSRHTATSRTTK